MEPRLLITIGLATLLTACADFVKRDDFDSAIGDLQSADSDLRAQLEGLESRFSQLSRELAGTFEDYDARIADLQGRLRIDMTAHFDYDDATLRDADKEALMRFSEVMRDYHANVLVTVEGFADPAGPAEYNRQLGLRRANAVREYLLSQGLEEQRVRAVSYGEDQNRQVKPGASGEAGEANRRVALVVDYIPS